MVYKILKNYRRTFADVILYVKNCGIIEPPCSVISTRDVTVLVAGHVIADVTADVYDSRVSCVAAVQFTV